MISKFPRVLSALRQEAGVSQREAAQQLGVSQALLSHYENGIREPGLSFVIRACDYYGVSADVLLGRTAADGLPRHSGPVEEDVPSGAKALHDAATVLLSFLREGGNTTAACWAEFYMDTVIYDLVRYLCRFSPDHAAQAFSIDQHSFLSAATATDLLYVRSQYRRALSNRDGGPEALPVLTPDLLRERYPDACESLIRMVRITGQRINAFQSVMLQGLEGSDEAKSPPPPEEDLL